jgi:hypothetical protein
MISPLYSDRSYLQTLIVWARLAHFVPRIVMVQTYFAVDIKTPVELPQLQAAWFSGDVKMMQEGVSTGCEHTHCT